MMDSEILIKAIMKAVKNGYKHTFVLEWIVDGFESNHDWHYNIIFSHEFAKAFFGNKGTGMMKACLCGEEPREIMEWQLHLQIMVLEEDPIKYLKQFI